MKYIITILIMTFTIGMKAQKLSFEDGIIDYKEEQVQTIDVILSPKVETIKDRFEDWMDDNYDVDLDGKKLLFFNKEFLSANGVIIPQISNKKIDLKVKVDETNNGFTRLNVFASFGYNNWISETNHPFEHAALRGIVYDFVSDYLPEYYLDKVADSEEKITDLTEKRSDLNDDVKDNEEEILKLQKENEKLLRQLKSNQARINGWKSEMSKRNMEYQEIKNKISDIK